MIKRFKEILAQYKEVSLFMQSSQEVTIPWAFPVLDKIMEDIEKFHSTGRWGDDAITQALHLAWEALAKYYRVMSQSAYYVCLFLDPQVISTYMENLWEEDWVAEGEERLQEAWRQYKNLDDAPHSALRSAITAARPIPPNPFRHAVQIGSQQHGPPPDELELYRRMPVMSQEVWESRYQCNPLLWWADTGQVLFLRLALMPKDFFSAQRKTPSPYGVQDQLCLPVSTVPAERMFSAAGNAQEQHQARMAPDTLQAIMTLREWWKPGVLGFDSVLDTGTAAENSD
jgi:hypothetical protein